MEPRSLVVLSPPVCNPAPLPHTGTWLFRAVAYRTSGLIWPCPGPSGSCCNNKLYLNTVTCHQLCLLLLKLGLIMCGDRTSVQPSPFTSRCTWHVDPSKLPSGPWLSPHQLMEYVLQTLSYCRERIGGLSCYAQSYCKCLSANPSRLVELGHFIVCVCAGGVCMLSVRRKVRKKVIAYIILAPNRD